MTPAAHQAAGDVVPAGDEPLVQILSRLLPASPAPELYGDRLQVGHTVLEVER